MHEYQVSLLDLQLDNVSFGRPVKVSVAAQPVGQGRASLDFKKRQALHPGWLQAWHKQRVWLLSFVTSPNSLLTCAEGERLWSAINMSLFVQYIQGLFRGMRASWSLLFVQLVVHRP
jgi:hypothetical protein